MPWNQFDAVTHDFVFDFTRHVRPHGAISNSKNLRDTILKFYNEHR